jgi:hypothetical protein
MSKLLNESKYEVNFKESPFYKPGIPIGKNLQIYYLLPSSAKGYTDREGLPYKIRKSWVIDLLYDIAANKSSKEVIDDERKRLRRTLSNGEVNWDTHTAQDFKLLKLSLLILIRRCCFHVQIVRRQSCYFNNTSPRHRYYLYINKGIDFIGNFSISTHST